MVKHVATWEARYFGEVFSQPFPAPLPSWEDSDGSDLWAAEGESRQQIIGFYRRAWEHADRTMNSLSIDAPGHVPWWPHPEVTVFSILVHVLTETTRHTGHADILREHIDGRTGVAAGPVEPVDPAAREAHCARIEASARAAQAIGRA